MLPSLSITSFFQDLQVSLTLALSPPEWICSPFSNQSIKGENMHQSSNQWITLPISASDRARTAISIKMAPWLTIMTLHDPFLHFQRSIWSDLGHRWAEVRLWFLRISSNRLANKFLQEVIVWILMAPLTCVSRPITSSNHLLISKCMP